MADMHNSLKADPFGFEMGERVKTLKVLSASASVIETEQPFYKPCDPNTFFQKQQIDYKELKSYKFCKSTSNWFDICSVAGTKVSQRS
jgi:hypothetical protein